MAVWMPCAQQEFRQRHTRSPFSAEMPPSALLFSGARSALDTSTTTASVANNGAKRPTAKASSFACFTARAVEWSNNCNGNNIGTSMKRGARLPRRSSRKPVDPSVCMILPHWRTGRASSGSSSARAWLTAGGCAATSSYLATIGLRAEVALAAPLSAATHMVVESYIDQVKAAIGTNSPVLIAWRKCATKDDSQERDAT